MTHPDELLAEYVDGSLRPDERAVVESHLAGCDQCTDEVAAARSARASLAGLEDLPVPEHARPRLRGRRVRRVRTRRTAWVAGAAAASIAAVVGIAVVNGGGGGGSVFGTTAGPREAASAPSSASLRHTTVNYTPRRVDQLAAALAAEQKAVPAPSEALAGGGSAGGSTPPGTTTTTAGSQATPAPRINFGTNAGKNPATCLRQVTGLPTSVHPVAPIIVAKFQGEPAYIGAYLQNGLIKVWAVSQGDCFPFYSTSIAVG